VGKSDEGEIEGPLDDLDTNWNPQTGIDGAI
jgi:hypothetical protein